MKKKTTIDQLKSKGGLPKLSKPIIAEVDVKAFEAYQREENRIFEYGAWLLDFLERKKKRFETFIIEVEQMYGEGGNKAATVKKQGKNDQKIKERPDRSNFATELRNKKCGLPQK